MRGSHVKRFAALAAALLAFACPAAATAQPVQQEGAAWATAARLHRGVNIIGYDPIWTDRTKARFKPRYFPMLRRAGFDFVRVVLQSFKHMDAANRLDPQWLATLDWVVNNARAAGLSVIIDEHDFDTCSKDPVACRPKLEAFWRQVGARYKAQPDSVIFELMNEPHDKLDGEGWNQLHAAILPIVRATNPRRTVIIGPTHWNSLNDLPLLKLPADDRNILVTFHYYEPFRFTHQGAGWTDMKDVRDVPFTPADQARVREDIAKAAAWSKANDRPILLGEFGAYDRGGSSQGERARYAATVRSATEAAGIPWAYWQFDGDFVLYDIDHERWITPIRDALVPPKR